MFIAETRTRVFPALPSFLFGVWGRELVGCWLGVVVGPGCRVSYVWVSCFCLIPRFLEGVSPSEFLLPGFLVTATGFTTLKCSPTHVRGPHRQGKISQRTSHRMEHTYNVTAACAHKSRDDADTVQMVVSRIV